jgi:8-oxo-dGTP pyrophosphatase MutT (NUDIX family)
MEEWIRSVNVLVRDAAGRTFLQMRDGRARLHPLMWGFWGGGMSAEDADIAACAARELQEELRLAAAPADFEHLSERVGSDGQVAPLLLYRPPVHWSDVTILEGAGAGFFWRSEILQLPISKPLADHLRTDPELFGEGAPLHQSPPPTS